MEPISAGLGIVGLGLQLFGGISSSQKAKQASQINQKIAVDEGRINEQKRQQMELEGRRSQMEVFRNAQRLRAQATAAATNQGATFGSGIAGGLAQVTDQASTNLVGIGQNLEIGRNIFDINADVSRQKQALSSVSSDMATDAALGSLGGALVKYGPTIGGLAKDYTAGWGYQSKEV